MKKLILLTFLLFSLLTFGQTIKVFNNPVKLKQTANLGTVDSLLTKDANDFITATAFTDFKTQLSLGVFLTEVVEDLTPQLGGGLDLNTFDITGTGNINHTGTLTSTGAIQGLNLTITNDVTFTNYPNVRVDATPINFLHTDASGNLLSSQVSAIVTGLESITENTQQGWRLIGRDPANYGDTGINAIDFSFSGSPSITIGATGDQSVSFGDGHTVSGFGAFSDGFQNTASNTYSHAFGQNGNAGGYSSFTFGLDNIATGDYCWAIGDTNQALGNNDRVFGAFNIGNSFTHTLTTGIGNTNTGAGSFVSGIALTNTDNWGATVIGQANTDFTGSGATRSATDRIFVLGNGTHTTPVGAIWLPSVKSDAMVVLRSGEITAPSLTTTIIDAEATGKVLVTKEWVNTQTASTLQEVTDAGSTTTNDITISDAATKRFKAEKTSGSLAEILNSGILRGIDDTGDLVGELRTTSLTITDNSGVNPIQGLLRHDELQFTNNVNELSILPPATITGTRTATFQDASGTLAFLSDIGVGVSPLTTKGDVFTFSTVDARLPVGTNGQVLSANSAQTTGLEWVSDVAFTNIDNDFSAGQSITESFIRTPSSLANLLTTHDTASNGISILSGNTSTGSIFFGDTEDEFIGGIRYNHSANQLQLYSNNVIALTIDNSQNAIVVGNATANSIIKSGATSDDVLLGDGTTTSLAGIGGSAIVYKVSDESTTNDTTLTADSELSISVDISTEYIFEAMLLMTAGSSTPDLKYNVSVLTDADFLVELWTGDPLATVALSNTSTVNLTTSENSLLIKGTFKSSGTATTISIDWAQLNSNASATTMKAGSYLKLEKAN